MRVEKGGERGRTEGSPANQLAGSSISCTPGLFRRDLQQRQGMVWTLGQSLQPVVRGGCRQCVCE